MGIDIHAEDYLGAGAPYSLVITSLSNNVINGVDTGIKLTADNAKLRLGFDGDVDTLGKANGDTQVEINEIDDGKVTIVKNS